MKKIGKLSVVSVLCAFVFVSVLLLTAAVPASATSSATSSATYPTLQYDAQRTGNVGGAAPETASLLWQSGEKTAGCVQAGPVVLDGRVFFTTWWSGGMGVEGNASDALYCLDEETGEEVWNNTAVFGASTAAVAAAEGKLFVGTHRGNFTCVDTASGEILWSRRVEENPSWCGVGSSPLVFDGTVFVLTFSDGTLHAFSFEGAELWNFSTGEEIFKYASPSAYEDKIFFAGNSTAAAGQHGRHALYCLNLSTHEEEWNFTTDTEVLGTPTIWSEGGEGGLVFFTTKYVFGKEYGIYALNATTGEEVWYKKHKSSWASPAVSNGRLYIGGSSDDTTFYCYDARDGTLIWENEEMGGAVDSSPVVADGKVYFGESKVNGTVYCLDAENGSVLWNYTLYIPPGFGGGFNSASPPAVADGTLFVGVDNVGVLAFRDPLLPDPLFWEGEVTLTENATTTVTAHDSGASYEINQTTALGALAAAAAAGGFNYTVSDKWYASWGSLLVDSIAGKWNDPVTWDGWLYWVNYPDDPMPGVGPNKYEVEDGDLVTFYYGGMSATPENTPMLLRIRVRVTEPQVPECIVKISTDKLNYSPNETMNVALRISNPTNSTLTFNWFAGIPQFEFWTQLYSTPVSPGFNQSLNTTLQVGDWGATPFGLVFYVDLEEPETLQPLTADVWWCLYSPGEAGVGEGVPESIENIGDFVLLKNE